jgi:hypothetical protein
MRGGDPNMSVVKISPDLVRDLVGIPEVSKTSSLDEFSRRNHLLYPGGIRKASRESETIWKFSKESVIYACEVVLS